MVVLPSFKNQKILEEAFIHRSYLNEKGKMGNLASNERLEFLGDSILTFLTSDFLYKKFPDLPEGKLTNLRSFLVKTQTLAQTARELDLGRYLKLSRGEKEAKGQENSSLLANTFEALVGALFLDGGLLKTKTFLTKVLFFKVAEANLKTAFKDDKSFFQELIQKEKNPAPVYRVMKTSGPDHKKVFTVGVFVRGKSWGEGEGFSKQEAEQKAAKVALEKLKPE